MSTRLLDKGGRGMNMVTTEPGDAIVTPTDASRSRKSNTAGLRRGLT
jgi:hypothetical protein